MCVCLSSLAPYIMYDFGVFACRAKERAAQSEKPTELLFIYSVGKTCFGKFPGRCEYVDVETFFQPSFFAFPVISI